MSHIAHKFYCLGTVKLYTAHRVKRPPTDQSVLIKAQDPPLSVERGLALILLLKRIIKLLPPYSVGPTAYICSGYVLHGTRESSWTWRQVGTRTVGLALHQAKYVKSFPASSEKLLDFHLVTSQFSVFYSPTFSFQLSWEPLCYSSGTWLNNLQEIALKARY